jgi:condensation enzyme
MFDQGDGTGPLGPRYNIVVGWRLRGPLDVTTLAASLTDVAARHDVLRSEIITIDTTRFQQIHEPSPAQLEVRDLPDGDRDTIAEQLLGDVEAGSYPVEQRPHLRAVLGRFDDDDAVLVLIVHHTAGDGWSMQLLMEDLANCYAARRGQLAGPRPVIHTYRDYIESQQALNTAERLSVSGAYWSEKLRGAQILAVPTDHPRSAGLDKISPVHRFLISAPVTEGALALAMATRSSPFMVFFAVYNLLLHKMTGATDLVVPTLTSGRGQPEFQKTVGPFFNFVPLRTDLAGATTFRDVLDRTRSGCIEAMSYEIPFLQILGEAPELMAPMTQDTSAACAFQMWQFSAVMDHDVVGDLEYTEVRRRLLPQAAGTDIPDGALLTLDLDPSGEVYGNLAYNSNLYTEQTMQDMATRYCQILQKAVADPNAPLQTL